MEPKLILETGEVFVGKPLGAIGETYGELIFNTAISGYEEILTDPSYKGQIVVMTNPHIGNYGINFLDFESKNVWVEGFVVYETPKVYTNFRASSSLDALLKKCHIIGIQNIDTRYLTKLIRNSGSLMAMITYRDIDKLKCIEILKSKPPIEQRDLVKEVSTKKAYTYCDYNSPDKSVVVIDYGVKKSILEEFKKRGFTVEVVPYNIQVKELLRKNSWLYFFSNGPGDPLKVQEIATNQIRALVQNRKNIFCICLGHQLVALAFGVPTYKLLFGHHGANHPVKDLQTGRIYITSQNHNFAVKENEAQDKGFIVKFRNLYDGTLEGMYHSEFNIFSVQFHPEAGPGPSDAKSVFDEALDFFYFRNTAS
jgi:carbamoyl-phosphate synthase small subunit